MIMNITERLACVERVLKYGTDYHSKYIHDYFVSTRLFEAAIKRLGGYTYNTAAGRIGDTTIFNGFTWLSVHSVNSYENTDMWAKRFEQEFFEEIPISPIHVHHPDGVHTWGIEFNKERPFWNDSAKDFVKEASKLLGSKSGWFYQCGSDNPDKGYQFFEYMGMPRNCLASLGSDSDELKVRAAAVEIADTIGTVAFIR